MKFPRNNKKLTKIFKEATDADISDLSSGEFYIHMLTIVPSLRRIKHRKIFKSTSECITGNNILWKKFKWGCFFLEQKKCIKFPELDVVVINYNVKENSFISNIIRDEIRCIEKTKRYLGRFNLVLFGKPRFWGYFTMTKKEEPNE